MLLQEVEEGPKSPDMPAYEKQRNEIIAKNKEKMRELVSNTHRRQSCCEYARVARRNFWALFKDSGDMVSSKQALEFCKRILRSPRAGWSTETVGERVLGITKTLVEDA